MKGWIHASVPKNKTYDGFGEITLTPSPKWRKFWILGKVIPYFVGQQILFKLHTKKWDNNPFGHEPYYVIEVIGSNTTRIEVKYQDAEIAGSIIANEGEVKYSVSKLPSGGNSIPIFTAYVINWDRWLPAFIGIIVGAFFSVPCSILAGILLGFIQVKPFWSIWMP